MVRRWHAAMIDALVEPLRTALLGQVRRLTAECWRRVDFTQPAGAPDALGAARGRGGAGTAAAIRGTRNGNRSHARHLIAIKAPCGVAQRLPRLAASLRSIPAASRSASARSVFSQLKAVNRVDLLTSLPLSRCVQW